MLAAMFFIKAVWAIHFAITHLVWKYLHAFCARYHLKSAIFHTSHFPAEVGAYLIVACLARAFIRQVWAIDNAIA